MSDILLKPEQGTVAFESGKEGWSLTCTKFAELYATKFNTEIKKLQDKFWGENYFDTETKFWIKESHTNNGKELKRAFVGFILDPICRLTKVIMNGETEIRSKNLLKTVMSKWINVADNLIQMMIYHLPSPKQAQKYRTSYFYEGSQNNDVAQSIRDCNPNGPLVMFISQVIQSGRENFIAFGRVFSGTIKQDQKMRIMGPNCKPCLKEDIFQDRLEGQCGSMGEEQNVLKKGFHVGNVIGLIGDNNILTISSTISDHPECHLIRSIKSSIAPVTKMAASPKIPRELPRLIKGLRRLPQANQTIEYSIEDSCKHFIAGCSQQLIQKSLTELDEHLDDLQLEKTDPIVVYKETVTAPSKVVCMAKSANQHNKLLHLMKIYRLLLESRANILAQEYDWNKDDALKIWTFGPDDTGPNILCDQTVAAKHINEIRESIQFAWQQSTKEGALCQENLRGVRLNILDCVMSAETIHRGEGQIIPTARRLYSACELTAQPRLQEPILLTKVTVPNQVTAGVYSCLSIRQEIIIDEEQIVGSPLTRIKSYLPVAQSFGYATHLRSLTLGQAFPECQFDHWAVLGEDPFEHGSKVNEIVLSIRKRKGLGTQLPNIDEYLKQP